MEIAPAPSPHPSDHLGTHDATTQASDTAKVFEKALSNGAVSPDGVTESEKGIEQNEQDKADTKTKCDAPPAFDRTEASDESDICSDCQDDPIKAMLEYWSGVASTISDTGPEKNVAMAWSFPSIGGARSGMMSGADGNHDFSILEGEPDTQAAATNMEPSQTEASLAIRPGVPRQNAVVLMEENTSTHRDAALLPTQITASEAVLHRPEVPANQASQSTNFPSGSVARQIADAIITTRDEMVEIALSPEELGRVRMVLTGNDRAPHLTIWAERAETLELMRRHGEQLLQHFRDDGMPDTMLDFRNGQQQSHHNDNRLWHDGTAEAALLIDPSPAATGPQDSITSVRAGDRRLDIRI